MRLAVGFAAAPLSVALLGWGLVRAGVELPRAAALLSALALAAWIAAGARRAPATPGGDDGTTTTRGVVWLAAALAAVVVLVPVLNPFIAVRGDSWTHGGIVARILESGLPPEDPRFAAIPLHYVWFYNFFVALASALGQGEPFYFMVWLNGTTAFASVVLVAAVSRDVWKRADAGLAAGVLLIFGLNAGAWLLWPLRLVRAFTGEVRGWDEVIVQARTIEFGWARIIYSLSAPFAHMISFLDKLLVGSPLAYGYLLMLGHLWCVMRWIQRGRFATLWGIAYAAAGMMFFHGVVGLSVLPVWIGTLVLALLLRARLPWLGSPGRLAAAAGATLAGGLVATPFMISVASGWASSASGLRHSYIDPVPSMPWTYATACAVALVFAVGPAVSAWREQDPRRALLALYLVAMIVFGCVVHLPENNQVKFVYQAFVPAVALAAPGFGRWVAGFWRASPRRAAPVFAALFLVPAALTLHGYVADAGRRLDPDFVGRPGEADMDRWIRGHTAPSAMIVDNHFRDALMVRGRRALYLGTEFGPERAAFPLDQVIERRRVVTDLYGPARALDLDARALARFGRPVYLVYRPEDDATTGAAWAAVRAAGGTFDTVYDQAGYRVARVIGAGGAAR